MAGLYNGLFAMADRETGSVWSHFEGLALFGPLAGSRLEVIPMVQMRWEDWREAHPGTLVLDPDTGFQDRYRKRAAIGGAGLGPAFEATLLNRDERLAENEIVLGVVHEGEARAYPMEAFPAGPAALNDELGDQAIVVLSDRGSGQAMAFQREVGGETLVFSSEGGVIRDEGGAVWSLDGVCQEGWCLGERLAFVTSFVTEWYGWAAYHPETTVFLR